MKMVFVTLFTPTTENRLGPSALPYYLMKYRKKSIDIAVFSFNLNKIEAKEINDIEKKLSLKVHLLRIPRWYRFISNPRHKMTAIRVFLRHPLLSYIKLSSKECKRILRCQPDLIWWYPSLIFRVFPAFERFRHIVTCPDCNCLTPIRALWCPDSSKTMLRSWGYWRIFFASMAFESALQTKNALFHLVGQKDIDMLRAVNPAVNAFFLLHPHYETTESISIDFTKRRLRVLIAGKKECVNIYDTVRFVDKLTGKYNKVLAMNYEFTFLGKGWEDEVERMRTCGYRAKHCTWVDNYIESIAQFDIQLAFMTVGAGTKGKVLDACSNGLLVIGSECSLENIAVRHNDSCLLYKNMDDVIFFLHSIVNNPSKYENIARKGLEQVRKFHSPQRISQRFYNIIEKHK